QDYPEVLINLKTIPGLSYIQEEDGWLKIGALTRLRDIAIDPIVLNKYTALAEAAHKVASPAVREMGTIGGNICQLIRCWYFRAEENYFDCLRKGGQMCNAGVGDNRYHSIFGATRVCASPCTANCPAGNDVPSYLSQIRNGGLAESAGILLNTNPLPAITGRVCPHQCEKDCNRNEFGEAVSIRSIERFVGDYALENASNLYLPPQKEANQKVAVVGSGPAGLAAAYYLRQLGYRVTVFEALEKAGGVLTYGIPAYRLPRDVVEKQVKAIAGTGVQFKYNVIVGVDITLADLHKDYDAVFLASGAWKQPALSIPDEELLTPALDFLAQVSRGLRKISAQKVLVIGGGSVAMDVATTVKRLGIEDVTVACLESRAEMPALHEEVEQAIAEGIRIRPSWGPARIIKTNGKLSGMELMRCLSVFNGEGRFAPTYDINLKETLEADMIILAIGQRPDLAYVGSELKTNRGLIAVDDNTQATSKTKIFAGGDATLSGPLSVVAAIASGRRAAVAINLYLGGQPKPAAAQPVEHLERYTGEDFEKLSRVKTPLLPLSQLSLAAEDLQGLELSAVETEANRCFNCGCDGVNPSDMAAALVALNARIVTSSRIIPADQFWVADQGVKATVLDDHEIVTEIQIPALKTGARSAFVKFALRKSIDFPIVNCAASIECEGGVVKSARICLNAVYNKPYRATKAEEAITGKVIDEASAEAAGSAAVSDAIALPYNKFKIQIARTMIKRAILGCQ
ncbi:MAG TPA: FAD-dependent oxidoreductase, partial [Dehalococcoidales bacterium]|nr:FAD-dependent oxidoreductase [Dehalococcoidales bacterium]